MLQIGGIGAFGMADRWGTEVRKAQIAKCGRASF
jgi:hypothetical protein